jgi:hypothetical protein
MRTKKPEFGPPDASLKHLASLQGRMPDDLGALLRSLRMKNMISEVDCHFPSGEVAAGLIGVLKQEWAMEKEFRERYMGWDRISYLYGEKWHMRRHQCKFIAI